MCKPPEQNLHEAEKNKYILFALWLKVLFEREGHILRLTCNNQPPTITKSTCFHSFPDETS